MSQNPQPLEQPLPAPVAGEEFGHGGGLVGWRFGTGRGLQRDFLGGQKPHKAVRRQVLAAALQRHDELFGS